MPWREDPSPYGVVVSELMLQQTQVSRVIPKYNSFLYTYTNFDSLAEAPFSDVLKLWSGLGYNRRAKYLHQIAQIVCYDCSGVLPNSYEALVKLPGIGPNTAGAILAYAFNQPAIFIETNIRTVLFHHFFQDKKDVADTELRHVLKQVIDSKHPRQWYWALMDYGTHLKATTGGKLDVSKHYKKQRPLRGSVREMRGEIVRRLLKGPCAIKDFPKVVQQDKRLQPAIEGLMKDGMVEMADGILCLTGSNQTS